MPRDDAVGVLILAIAGVLVLSFGANPLEALTGALVVFGVAATLYTHVVERLHERASDDVERDAMPVGVRDARDAYVAGEIDEAELDDRLERALDPDVRAIREHFEPIDDVGPATCRRLADHFGTVESIQGASVDDLERVDGVGPSRASKIAEASRE